MGAAQVAVARAAAEEAGVAVTGLHWLLVKPAGLSISSKDAAVRKRTLDVMFALVDLCAALGGRYLVHGSPQQRRLEAGESYFYLSNRYTLSRIFGRDLMTPRALAARARHMSETILNAVRK